ncbi:hypothetical protein DFH08DRAFT_687426, partial [Mycena albidolilacea]
GDAVFHAPRRCFQNALSGKQNQWAYLKKRYKAVPFLGSFHTTDIFNVFKGGELTDYLINFVNSPDPNGKTVPTWPGYMRGTEFNDDWGGADAGSQDTFRVDAMKVLTNVSLPFPI